MDETEIEGTQNATCRRCGRKLRRTVKIGPVCAKREVAELAAKAERTTDAAARDIQTRMHLLATDAQGW